MVGFALVVRAAALPFAENVLGDAVARTWLALDWADEPNLPISFAHGVKQYGPLHVVLLGMATWVVPSPQLAGGVLSLLFGAASIVPLMALARRLFDERAAVVAASVFALWGLHVQSSTTAASEALCLFLVLTAIACMHAGADERRIGPLIVAALATTLACATRYDLWIWAPLFCGWVLWRTRDVKVALLFAAIVASFPLLWMAGNFHDLGDALFPLRDIDRFHRDWYQDELAFWGAAKLRLMALFFWPGAAVMSLSPLAAAAGVAGALLVLRRPHPARWLVVLALATIALYTARSLLFESFVPLARFTMKELALLCLFVEPGAAWLAQRLRLSAPGLRGGIVASAAVWLVLLQLGVEHGRPGLAQSLAPIAPISRNPRDIEPVLAELRRLAAEGDYQLAFHGGFPRERVARRRFDDFEITLARGDPRWLVRFDGGPLAAIEAGDGSIDFRGRRFEPIGPVVGSIRLYAATIPGGR
jgi:hypothetical protein